MAKSKSKSKSKDVSRRAILIGARSRRRSDLAQVIEDLHLVPRDLRVGVDGGVDAWKKLGLSPHFAIGDWDSIEAKSRLKGIVSLTLPKKKDRSDLYYACDAAIELGATDLICVGVTGGRPDHHLATLLDLAEIAATRRNLNTVCAIGDDGQYFFLSSKLYQLRAQFDKNQLVSVFSLGGKAKGVTLDGFRFPLKNAELEPSSLGLSNIAKGGPGSVSLKQGRVVVVIPETRKTR